MPELGQPLVSDGQTVETWYCQGCGSKLLIHYLNLRDGEIILEIKCRKNDCRRINTLTRIAGPSLPTNGQGRLGPASQRAVEPPGVTGGPSHGQSPGRQQ